VAINVAGGEHGVSAIILSAINFILIGRNPPSYVCVVLSVFLFCVFIFFPFFIFFLLCTLCTIYNKYILEVQRARLLHGIVHPSPGLGPPHRTVTVCFYRRKS